MAKTLAVPVEALDMTTALLIAKLTSGFDTQSAKKLDAKADVPKPVTAEPAANPPEERAPKLAELVWSAPQPYKDTVHVDEACAKLNKLAMT